MSVDVSVRIEGLDRLRAIIERAERALPRIIDFLAEAIEVYAWALAPRRTGRLASGIRRGGTGLQRYVTVGAPYAAYVEYGTRPHVIYPRRARALRFVVDGEVVYAKYVHHPGFPGRHFMRESIDRAIKHLEENLEQLLK